MTVDGAAGGEETKDRLFGRGEGRRVRTAIIAAHFDVLRIIKTCKFPLRVLFVLNGLNVAKRLSGLNDLNGPRCRRWLELLSESGFVSEEKLAAVKKETGELKGIFVSIVRNTKAKSKAPKS